MLENKGKIYILITLIVVFIVAGIYFDSTPKGKTIWNKWFFEVQKADDATDYETIKKIEDTCRAMIASYEADKLTYEQYKDSEDKEKRGWAEQAKMRANKTASSYNNYILQNSFVWKDNIPKDIKEMLEIIE